MSNLDEQKVKTLLRKIVNFADRQASENGYSWLNTKAILEEIDEADILTDQHACATVKHAKTGDDVREEQSLPKKDDNFYT